MGEVIYLQVGNARPALPTDDVDRLADHLTRLAVAVELAQRTLAKRDIYGDVAAVEGVRQIFDAFTTLDARH